MTRPESPARHTLAAFVTLAALALGDPYVWAEERVLTGKERLGGKGTDAQRVNDCKVPAAERDPARPRSPDCVQSSGQNAPKPRHLEPVSNDSIPAQE